MNIKRNGQIELHIILRIAVGYPIGGTLSTNLQANSVILLLYIDVFSTAKIEH